MIGSKDSHEIYENLTPTSFAARRCLISSIAYGSCWIQSSQNVICDLPTRCTPESSTGSDSTDANFAPRPPRYARPILFSNNVTSWLCRCTPVFLKSLLRCVQPVEQPIPSSWQHSSSSSPWIRSIAKRASIDENP